MISYLHLCSFIASNWISFGSVWLGILAATVIRMIQIWKFFGLWVTFAQMLMIRCNEPSGHILGTCSDFAADRFPKNNCWYVLLSPYKFPQFSYFIAFVRFYLLNRSKAIAFHQSFSSYITVFFVQYRFFKWVMSLNLSKSSLPDVSSRSILTAGELCQAHRFARMYIVGIGLPLCAGICKRFVGCSSISFDNTLVSTLFCSLARCLFSQEALTINLPIYSWSFFISKYQPRSVRFILCCDAVGNTPHH